MWIDYQLQGKVQHPSRTNACILRKYKYNNKGGRCNKQTCPVAVFSLALLSILFTLATGKSWLNLTLNYSSWRPNGTRHSFLGCCTVQTCLVLFFVLSLQCFFRNWPLHLSLLCFIQVKRLPSPLPLKLSSPLKPLLNILHWSTLGLSFPFLTRMLYYGWY